MDVFSKILVTNDYILDSIRINGRYLSLREGQTINTDDRIAMHAALAVIVPHLGSDFFIENTDLLNYFGNQDDANNFIFCLLRQFGPTGQRYFSFVLATDFCCRDRVKVVYDITAIRERLLTLNQTVPVMVNADSDSIELTWGMVENATSFVLEMAEDAPELVWSTVYTGSGLTFTATGLDNATGYWFRVTAKAAGLNDGIGPELLMMTI